jgi:hypothetical protein
VVSWCRRCSSTGSAQGLAQELEKLVIGLRTGFIIATDDVAGLRKN